MEVATGITTSVSTIELPTGARIGTPFCQEVCIDDNCGLCEISSPCATGYVFPRVLRLTVVGDPLNSTTLDDYFGLGGLDPTRRTTASRAFWTRSFLLSWQPLRPWESAGKWVGHAQRDEIYTTQTSYTFPGDWLEITLTLSRYSTSPTLNCFSIQGQYQSTGVYVSTIGYSNCSSSATSAYLDTSVSTLDPLYLRFRGQGTGWNGLLCDFNPVGGWYITE